MVPAGNKDTRFSLVNHTTKTIHHYQMVLVQINYFLVQTEIYKTK